MSVKIGKTTVGKKLRVFVNLSEMLEKFVLHDLLNR